MNERTERKARLRMVEIVLHWAWDPIGIRGVTEAADEYDSYALPVLGMLARAAPDREVVDYLTSVEEECIGLGSNAERKADIAAMLRELYASSHTDLNGS